MKGGGGRWKTVGVGGGAVLAAGLLVAPHPHRLSPPFTAIHRPDVHAEYVKFPSAGATITAYLAYPERTDPAPAVVVIHEIFGMSDFIRQTTEQVARDGFVAIAPDLLSRRGGTPASSDEARRLIAGLNADTLTLDLEATVAYLKTLKAARGDRIGVIGFCWGGGQSFRYATTSGTLRAFVVCYGPAPEAAAIARIRARGLGVYAENDARINGGLGDVDAAVRRYGKDYHYSVYPGVGHGFLRSRERPEVADSAWREVVRFFRDALER